MRKFLSILVACFMITVLMSGCGSRRAEDDDELRPVSSITLSEEEAQQLNGKVPICLYFANEDNTKLIKEVRYIAENDAKKTVNQLAAVIVKELIKGPSSNSGLKATIPKEAELRSAVSINAGIATVDFTKAFVDKHPGGKDAEQMTIYSIVNSLTELKDIQQVKFTIEGKAQENFKGNFKFNAPFPRTMSLVGKVTAPENSAGTDNKVNPKEDKATPKAANPKEQKSEGSNSTSLDTIDTIKELEDYADDVIEILE